MDSLPCHGAVRLAEDTLVQGTDQGLTEPGASRDLAGVLVFAIWKVQ